MDAVPESYVSCLVERWGAISEPVERAFRTVRRHRFVDGWYHLEATNLRVAFHPVDYDPDHPAPEQLDEIYSDVALITAFDDFLPTSSTSQPTLVVRMLELLELRPEMRVLEIGTGTGYNAALLAEIVGPEGAVHTVEIQEEVARKASQHLQGEGYTDVRVFHRDGYLGVPDAAPFDRIVATVGCSSLSSHWVEQLAPGGWMLVPLRHGLRDPLVRIERRVDRPECASGRIVGWSTFMPIYGTLRSANSWPSFAIRSLPKHATWTRRLPSPLSSESARTGHPLEHPIHRAIHFFLTLSSRELWPDARGYGLVDPGSRSVLVVTQDAVEGFSATDDVASLERLYDRFHRLVETWDQCGQPAPEDFSIEFVPFGHFEFIESEPEMEWIIERHDFHEIIHLPAKRDRPE